MFIVLLSLENIYIYTFPRIAHWLPGWFPVACFGIKSGHHRKAGRQACMPAFGRSWEGWPLSWWSFSRIFVMPGEFFTKNEPCWRSRGVESNPKQINLEDHSSALTGDIRKANNPKGDIKERRRRSCLHAVHANNKPACRICFLMSIWMESRDAIC